MYSATSNPKLATALRARAFRSGRCCDPAGASLNFLRETVRRFPEPGMRARVLPMGTYFPERQSRMKNFPGRVRSGGDAAKSPEGHLRALRFRAECCALGR